MPRSFGMLARTYARRARNAIKAERRCYDCGDVHEGLTFLCVRCRNGYDQRRRNAARKGLR